MHVDNYLIVATNNELQVKYLQELHVHFFLQSFDSLMKGRQRNIQHECNYGTGHSCHMEEEHNSIIAFKLT